ncbi:telomerase Cajal body protein 1 isoform X2 [Prorops nasuta]|uniref:telomerase Cajal body protein 1 isoform X2 n=1 Tax=Prorops nasuta TaxID=863751 RepID=UPI0034CF2A05
MEQEISRNNNDTVCSEKDEIPVITSLKTKSNENDFSFNVFKTRKVVELVKNQVISNSNHVEINETSPPLIKRLSEEETIKNKFNLETEYTSLADNTECKTNFVDWLSTPKLLCEATEEYQSTDLYENFTKGCQWSPDGTCILVPAEDYRFRIYELPTDLYSGKVPLNWTKHTLKSALTVKEGGLIYDSCWYPYMNSWDPATCCFLSTSKDSPAHLWDAFNGQIRATYRAYNQVDEVEACISIQFINFANEIWCGFKGGLKYFYTERPGRQFSNIVFKSNFPNVSGIVSCIRENPLMPGLIAFGTYSKCIGLYKDSPICTFKTGSGVTQIEFSPCGTKLYSAVRRSNEFLCWDLRNPGIVLHSFKGRESDTNQRIQFSISSDGNEIISGGTNGFLNIWQTSNFINHEDELDVKCKIQLSKDCVNGTSLHKTIPILATSTGQRICNDEIINQDNSVRFWYFQE